MKNLPMSLIVNFSQNAQKPNGKNLQQSLLSILFFGTIFWREKLLRLKSFSRLRASKYQSVQNLTLALKSISCQLDHRLVALSLTVQE